MLTLKILTINQLLSLLANIAICLLMLAEQVNGRPQDIIAETAKSALMAFQQGTEMLGNGGLISNGYDFELPFAKAISKTEIGAGQAMMQTDNSESSEEEDRRRRKRSLNAIMNDILGEESLLPSPPQHLHHIFKRASCHGSYGGGTGGGGIPSNPGTGGAGDGGDGIDVVERRRRARMRKANAAKKRRTNSSKKSTRKTKKSRIVSSDVDQPLTRRKRQSEQDDLNVNAGQNVAQHAQQFAEKIRNVWEGFINSVTQMAQSIKQKFSSSNPTATETI